MKRKTKALFIAFSLILLISSCTNSEKSKQTNSDYSSFSGLQGLLAEQQEGEDFYLVDVRTADEYSVGHIPEARNIPVDTIIENPPSQNLDDLIIVYCRSGGRSGRAAAALKDAGYTNIVDFGGVGNWKAELSID